MAISIYKRIRKRISLFIHGKKEVIPSEAYDLWAESYDQQPENLLIYLDKLVFYEMVASIYFENKTVIDIGCGTGRYWEKIYSMKPAEITGYDVLVEMLNKLHKKYPAAKAYLLNDNILAQTKTSSCDIIICNLVIGYIKNLAAAFAEWNRVLKNDGIIVISDFHPDALQQGDSRSFKHNDKLVLIKNYIHTLHKIRSLAR